MDLTQEILKKHLSYSKGTGEFRWIKPRQRIKVGDLAGSKHKRDFYVRIKLFGNINLAHRLAFLYVEGYFPENLVDHKDGDPSNNAWDNLREVSSSCNNRNRKISTSNKSGVTGVCFHKRQNKWEARVKENNKQINLGYFKTLTEAVQARHDGEIKYKYNNCLTTSTALNYLKEKGLIK